jgi:glutamate-1-semialdehyde 2,1-aminomutase
MAWLEDKIGDYCQVNRADKFRHLFARIPGGCSTAAKSPLRNPASSKPYYATAAAGGRFTDEEGHEWLDFDMALSAAILGYAHDKVDEAVIQQIRRGMVFSVPSPLEAQVAQRLFERFPVAECVRFCKDGSDATSAAVRIARSVTGRTKIVAAAYHGWHDWSAVHYYGAEGVSHRQLGISSNVAAETVWLPLETFAQFEATVTPEDRIAGIILCPENWTEPDLKSLSEYCRIEKTILIFDEVKSGIRYGARGVSGTVGVVPDLICLGKSIANGFPLAVLGGRAELMSLCSDINFSTTAASEAASLAAALAVDDHLRASGQWPPWHAACGDLIARLTDYISNSHLSGHLAIHGYPGNFRLHTPGFPPRRDPFRKVLVEMLITHGIFSTGYIAPCAAHSAEDFSRLETAMLEAIREWGRRVSPL